MASGTSKSLQRLFGVLVAGGLATSANAQDRPAATPLQVSPPASIVADGRTAVSIPVSGGPAPAAGELASHPELPRITCEQAISLPATRSSAPSLIVPATMAEKSLPCVATLRGESVKFQVATTKPPKRGLYAKAKPHLATSATRGIELHTFQVDGQGKPSAATSLLRVNTNLGTATMGESGLVQVALPPDKAPRTLVVAFADGERHGVSFVPVAGVTQLDAEADNKAKVRLRIAGQWFGPVVAKRKKARLKIVVPPGARDAVVRSVGRKGFAAESMADLKVPDRQRIAAVLSSDKVRASQVAKIVVALVDEEGRPAKSSTKLIASATRGVLGQPQSAAPGMWVLLYTGPETQGEDQIQIRVDGDPGAGAVTLDTEIIPDSAGRVSINGLAKSYEPEGKLVAQFVVLDKHDNPVTEGQVTATLGGETVTVTKTKQGYSLAAAVPSRLPEDRELPLVITAGPVSEEIKIKTHPLAAAKAEIQVIPMGRNARVRVNAYDRYGNLVPAEDLKLSAEGATIGEASEGASGPEFLVSAGPSSRIGQLTVHSGSDALTSAKLEFTPPPGALLIGGYAHGGWSTNAGVLSEPRIAGGLGLQRLGARVDLSFHLGIESFAFNDSNTMDLAGAPRSVDRSILALEFPALLRARLRLTPIFGVSLGAALVATQARVEIVTDFQPATNYTEFVVGTRGLLAGDAQLGPGRLQLGLSYGQSKLEDGLVEGNLDGWIAQLGYEWWFADLSR